jgi:S1-C subfamily serine protease
MFVQNGKITERPENWPEVARDEELLPRILAGVGRIETAAHVKLGTGFLVGERRVLTNNHVLCALFDLPLEHWRKEPAAFAKRCTERSEQWTSDPAGRPLFELRGELGSTASSTARLTRVLGHHLEVDMSLVEIDANPADSRVLPLMAAEPAPFQGRRVYAVGYPVEDSRNLWGQRITPTPVFRRVFGADDESLGTKRFSPGTVLGWRDANVFTHDASTLPGSSGSCIVDFEDRRVVGLHYGGRYKDQNYAVSLWKLRDDAVLKDNGIAFS